MMRALTARQRAFGGSYFALALPSIYLLLGGLLVLRRGPWSGTQIGLLQLAGLPAVLKARLWRFPLSAAAGGGGYRAAPACSDYCWAWRC